MEVSHISYHKLPLLRPLKGAFYWVIPGIMNYELMHDELFQDRVPHWFVPNLDPSFEEHCSVAWAHVERDRVDCVTCGQIRHWRVTSAKARSLPGFPDEVMDIDSEVGVSEDVSKLLADQSISGSIFFPAEDVEFQEDAAIWSSHELVCSGTRLAADSACTSCGNDMLLCPACNRLLPICPGCSKRRKYHSDSHRRDFITVSLRDWSTNSSFCVEDGTLVISGQAMKLVLEQKLFGFMFGEVLAETHGASLRQMESAVDMSIELAELHSMIPGGSENNAEVMRGMI